MIGKLAIVSLDLSWLLAAAIALPLFRWLAGRPFRRPEGFAFPVVVGAAGAKQTGEELTGASVTPAGAGPFVEPARLHDDAPMDPTPFHARQHARWVAVTVAATAISAAIWLVRQPPPAPRYFGPPPGPYSDLGGKW